MEDMACLWSYQESIEELKQKLLYTTLELESVRMEASESMRRNKEDVKQLLQLLNTAYQERDEATSLLHSLFSNPPSKQPLNHPNSNITESHNNYSSISSSPVDSSFFDSVSSPDFSTLNNNNNLTDQKNNIPNFSVNSSQTAPRVVDQGSLVIESLVKGKALPQRGKLVAAMEATAPLLQTLLWSGSPMPTWNNPPPVRPIQLPPVAVKLGRVEAGNFNQKNLDSANFDPSYFGSSSQMMMMMSNSMLSFGGSSCFGDVLGSGGYVVPTGKRQRFQ